MFESVISYQQTSLKFCAAMDQNAEKIAKFKEVRGHYTKLTPEEIWDSFITNHNGNYIQEIRNLDCEMSIKVQLMRTFFKNQQDLIVGQQLLCKPAPLLGPISAEAAPANSIDNSIWGETHTTRSGRVTKRSVLLQPTYSETIKKGKPDIAPKTNRQLARLNQEKPSTSIIAEYKQLMAEYGGSSNAAFDSLLEKTSTPNSVIAIDDSEDFVISSQETNHSEDVVKNSQEKLEALSLKASGDETKSGKKQNRFFVSKNGAKDLQPGGRTSATKEWLPGGRVINNADLKEENEEPLGKRTGKKRKLYAAGDEERFPCPWCGQSFIKTEIDEHGMKCVSK